MGIFSTLREHAAMASGSFGSLFKELSLPPLPAAVAQLLAEIQRPEPDVKKLTLLLTADPEIAAKILRTVNSALFNLKNEVMDVGFAITLLGLKRIRALVIPYAVKGAVPVPDGDLFDHEAFWTDSVLRALLARSLAKRCRPEEAEEAFAAALLADVALPVLLTSWRQYYEPVVERWTQRPGRLSGSEREDFDWDHAQAGAWILRHWGLPEPMVCLIGAHNLSPDRLRELGLADSVALPLATASLWPSVLKPDEERCRQLLRTAEQELQLPPTAWPEIGGEIEAAFAAVFRQFDLGRNLAAGPFTLLDSTLAELGIEREGSPQP